MAMVHKQNKYDADIGGHISTYASQATLLEVGFNHFFRGSYCERQGRAAGRLRLLPGTRFAGRLRARVSRRALEPTA